MAENDINTSNLSEHISLDEIVFQKRNKEYGAYFLRKKYKKFMLIAFGIAFLIIGTTVAVPLIDAYRSKNKLLKRIDKSVSLEMEKLNQEEAPPPPPPPPPPAAIEAQVKFKAPVVVDTVKEDVVLATIDDIKEDANEAPPEEIVVEEKKDEVVEADEPAFVIVEENASFMGGDINSYRLWVQQNIVFPTAAAEAGIAGKVIVQFAVNSKGKVVDAKVLRGVHPELDKEAIRCIMGSPQWTPGKQGGKSVKQQFVIPIVFQLQ
jgi:periplasmic protein TonB